MILVDLKLYNNLEYNPGGGRLGRFLWYFVNALFFINPFNPISSLKVALLRLFGAKIGRGCIIKPGVNIKYPWRLTVGDNCWIGENVWIDNLADVKIGDNVCISQGAMLLCGNHNYKKIAFDLIIQPIVLENGSWVCAKSMVCPGVTLHSHAVLGVSSVAHNNLEAFSIYQGNPARKVRNRIIH